MAPNPDAKRYHNDDDQECAEFSHRIPHHKLPYGVAEVESCSYRPGEPFA